MKDYSNKRILLEMKEHFSIEKSPSQGIEEFHLYGVREAGDQTNLIVYDLTDTSFVIHLRVSEVNFSVAAILVRRRSNKQNKDRQRKSYEQITA
jgi:hypothetical protein